MKQAHHPPNQTPDDALFRYQVICQVLTREKRGELRHQAITEVSILTQMTVDGTTITVSRRSIYRWLAAYEKKGFSGLMPAPRTIKDSYVIPEHLLNFFKEQKKDDPRVSVPELIRRSKQLNLADADMSDRVTVWRSLRRMGIDTKRHKCPKNERDTRRFAYPHRMDMVLCDGKHFRVGQGRLKRVALFFIDDATRMALGVVVGTAESAGLFLRGLYQLISTYGLMLAIYLDRGPGFKANDTIDVLRTLNILFIQGAPAYPQGHGKVERFNQTANEQVLRNLDGNPEVDTDCGALELRLNHYLMHQYIQEPHESLDKDPPLLRFQNDKRTLRFAENQEKLRQSFIIHKKRRVSNDHVVSLNSVAYEVPRGNAGKWIVLRHNVLTSSISIIDQGREVKLSPVDLHANARDKRAKFTNNNEDAPKKLLKSSAQIAFDKDTNPMVNVDGGFPLPGKNNNEEKMK